MKKKWIKDRNYDNIHRNGIYHWIMYHAHNEKRKKKWTLEEKVLPNTEKIRTIRPEESYG